MQTRDFHYDLPESLIAQKPVEERSASRLLKLGRASGEISHHQFRELPGFFRPGDLLVFNDTRVIPARLYGSKATGGKVEILVERLLDDYRCLAQVRASKSPKVGSQISIDGTPHVLKVEARRQDMFELASDNIDLIMLMQSAGHTPLPPYIKRIDDAVDLERYQTVYATQPGAVAAPTAGLHFDDRILSCLQAAWIDFAYVTLHVGAGTFQPVRCENIGDHQMHSEYVVVPEETVQLCHQARAQGRRIVAIGTTVVRSLESASAGGELASYQGETDIFIYPGYTFKSVDALLTNFHLPESTLLMLVCAFAGYELTMAAYRQAVKQNYRFFSYGDAMFIE